MMYTFILSSFECLCLRTTWPRRFETCMHLQLPRAPAPRGNTHGMMHLYAYFEGVRVFARHLCTWTHTCIHMHKRAQKSEEYIRMCMCMCRCMCRHAESKPSLKHNDFKVPRTCTCTYAQQNVHACMRSCLTFMMRMPRVCACCVCSCCLCLFGT